jgi:hypothetical protein
MATILPFPKVQGGDWTPEERARLDELAARFAGQAGIEVVLGRSDNGDPWCVVLDAQDEVLVHVARDRGSFIVHAAADDVFVRTSDLRSAVERVLGSRWLEDRIDVVVPFTGSSRAVQVITAVLVVGSFVEHHRAEAEPLDAWALAGSRPSKAPLRDLQRDDPAKVVVATDTTSASEMVGPVSLATLLEPVPGFELQLLALLEDRPAEHGRQLAAELVAASAAVGAGDARDIVTGTPGDDRLDGRTGPGERLLLDAGPGDDELLLDHGTIAIGGDGADRFVIQAPDTMPEAKADMPLLGVITDFDPRLDVVATDGGMTLTVVATVPSRNIFADPNVNLPALPPLPGAQLIVDLDNDGQFDGYVLVNTAVPGAVLTELRQFFGPDAGTPAALIVEPAAEAAMLALSSEVV